MPRTLFARTLVSAAVILLLAACQHLSPPSDQPPVNFRHDKSETKAKSCQDEQCPLVNLDTLFFPEEPVLNQLIDAHLRAMTLYNLQDPMPASLQSYQQDFLARAEPGWSTWLQAKIRDWHGPILVIELSSYLFQGGAHGLPGRAFINYQLDENRALSLQDMLKPGKEGAFWRLVEAAHGEWARKNHTEPLMEFLQHWPFRATSNIALLRDRVLLKYDIGEIAPYSSGHPELSLSYAQLQGVLRDRYLPPQ